MTYNKAIVAFLSSLFAILGGFGVDLGQWGSSEVITASSTLIGAGLVYAIPNR
jgi:hypothetical protein